MGGFITDHIIWKGKYYNKCRLAEKDYQGRSNDKNVLRSFAQLFFRNYSSTEKLHQTRNESVWSKTQHQKDGSLRTQLSLLERSFAQFSEKKNPGVFEG